MSQLIFSKAESSIWASAAQTRLSRKVACYSNWKEHSPVSRIIHLNFFNPFSSSVFFSTLHVIVSQKPDIRSFVAGIFQSGFFTTSSSVIIIFFIFFPVWCDEINKVD